MGVAPLCSLLLVLVLLLVHGCAQVSELRALMEVKAALDPEERYLASWKADGDPCRGGFEGVACNEHGKVANISLQGKGLSGAISPAISELRSLSGLYLHYNDISGQIPPEIANLTQLSDLYLNVNNISGSIPGEIGRMAGLQVLQLCYNQLTGSIPTQLGLLKKLNVLALQSNRLTGAIPATLGDLTELMRLDLSFNRLFGSIPSRVAKATRLMVLDVRNNTLSGNVPSDLKRLNVGFLYGNNSDLCGVGFTWLRACSPADRAQPLGPASSSSSSRQEIPQSANLKNAQNCNDTRCSSSSKSHAVAAAVVGVTTVAVAGLVSGLLAFSLYRRRRKQNMGEVSNSTSDHTTKDFLYQRTSASPLISLEYANGWDPLSDGRSGVGFSEEVSQSFRFNLEEVECATQHFSEVNLLGKKRHFAATYKGILRDGSLVAVKRISKTSCKSEEDEFLKGLKLLALLHHENLIGLRGFCCSRGRGECFLVYDFVANGDLSRYLDVKGEEEKGRILGWPVRVSIIKGIAKGIEYLHSSRAKKPSLVHQNISAEQILIDDNFNPLLSDSGLHNLLADDVVFSSLKASAAMGYLAPEYATVGRFTEKSDVYAFGVVIFQILTGKKGGGTTHLRLGSEPANLDDLIDEKLDGKFSRAEAAKLAGIALHCTSESPSDRPTTQMVLQELSSIC